MMIAGVNTKAIELTKDEEIKILSKLVEEFHGKGHYLSELFKPELLAWASQRIRDDIYPDVMDEVDHGDEMKTTLFQDVTNWKRAAENEAANRITEVEVLKEKIERLEDTWRAHHEIAKKDRARAEAAEERARKAEMKLEALRGALKWVMAEE